MAHYELILLGTPTEAQCAALSARIATAAAEFDLTIPEDFAIRTAADFDQRDPMAATVGLYFGGDPARDAEALATLEAARTPLVPVVEQGVAVTAAIPELLRPLNACFLTPGDPELTNVAAVALECLGLLREQRRIFVSYRRDDSREVAVQLHDELSARGFDVFLDTHDIRPGAVFQEMLWHRLVDSDIVVMLDTQHYFDSKWTKQELGRSLAQGIHVLRLVWPDHDANRFINLSDTVRLGAGDLDDAKRLSETTVDLVARRAEGLRSRSIAWRHRDLISKLRAEVLQLGGQFEGIGSFHSAAITLPNGKAIEAYPAIGIPSAQLLNEVHSRANSAGHGRFPCLVYNDTGIRPAWVDHLAWLDERLTVVRTLKVTRAAWDLAEWDSE